MSFFAVRSFAERRYRPDQFVARGEEFVARPTVPAKYAPGGPNARGNGEGRCYGRGGTRGR
jgi:hypothetical protein